MGKEKDLGRQEAANIENILRKVEMKKQMSKGRKQCLVVHFAAHTYSLVVQ